MSPGPHGPAELRTFLRRLKGMRRDPQPLLAEAKAMGDPARATQAFVALAMHEFASERLRDEAVQKAAERIRHVTREVQVAEVVPAVLKALAPTGQVRHLVPFIERLVALPNGEALSTGIRDAAKHTPGPLRPELFDRALQNEGYEREDGKAVLRGAFTESEDLLSVDGWRTRLRTIEDPDLRIRLTAFLHHQVASLAPRHMAALQVMQDVAAELDATRGPAPERERVDLWRTVVQTLASPTAVAPLLPVLEHEPDSVRADVALALGAQAHRLRDAETATRLFDEVETLLPGFDAQEADRIGRKLESARAHLEGRPAVQKPAQTRPVQSGNKLQGLPAATGHSLALCNTYTGGVKATHFRAVARAAPLCAAFGLDLVLVGFPVPLAELVERTARETRIGGHAWIQDLADAGRVHALPLDPAEDNDGWRARGTWIGTSERPTQSRVETLEEPVANGRVSVLMGVGPKGLPDGVRRACRGEYEITGQGVGLETATAMGILADRLGRAAARALGRV